MTFHDRKMTLNEIHFMLGSKYEFFSGWLLLLVLSLFKKKVMVPVLVLSIRVSTSPTRRSPICLSLEDP